MASLSNRYYQIDSTNQIIFESFITNLPTDFGRVGMTLLTDTIPSLSSTQLEDYTAWMPIRIVGNVVTVDDKDLAGNSGSLTTVSFITTDTDLNVTASELLSRPIWDLVYASDGVLTATENSTKLAVYNDQVAQERFIIRGGVAASDTGVIVEDTTDNTKDIVVDQI